VPATDQLIGPALPRELSRNPGSDSAKDDTLLEVAARNGSVLPPHEEPLTSDLASAANRRETPKDTNQERPCRILEQRLYQQSEDKTEHSADH
jgi:hypothetical protein